MNCLCKIDFFLSNKHICDAQIFLYYSSTVQSESILWSEMVNDLQNLKLKRHQQYNNGKIIIRFIVFIHSH